MIHGFYVKKPVAIEVLEATSSDDLHTRTGLRWRKTRIDGGEVYNELHDSWINFKFGDVFNITKNEDIYPIDRKTFFDTYEPESED